MKAAWLLAVVVAVAVPVVASALLASTAAPAPQQAPPARPACNATPHVLGEWAAKWWGPRGGWRVEVSSEFKERVLSILRSDPDTSKLLQQGYNVTAIRPVLTLTVGASGEATLKAKQAIVLLRSPSGHAVAIVDVEQGKVTKVVSVTKTVVSKS